MRAVGLSILLAIGASLLAVNPAAADLVDEYQPGPCITNAIVSTPFVDVAQSRFFTNAVGWAYLNEVTRGTDATHFSPDDPVTRGQFAALLHRMMCEPAPGRVAPFGDLRAGAFYRVAVDWLWDESLTTGKTSSTYGPDDSLTRGELATFLHRLVGEPTGAPASGFLDVDPEAFFADAIDWLLWRELTTGTTATTYSPNRTITRAEVVTFLYRLNIASTGLIDPADLKLGFSTVASGFTRPVAATIDPTDGSVYVVQQEGQVLRIPPKGDGTPDWAIGATVVLDISGLVNSDENEQGLLGVAVSPDGSKIYLSFTIAAGDSVIWEYGLSGGLPIGVPDEVIRVGQPFVNHNGGNIVFGPDGYLYATFGDGGSGGDPNQNGQNTSTLLGAILRIDPTTGTGYRVPATNPFVGGGGAAEVYAYGVRNPWKFSFDRDTGDLWVADVGQGSREELNRLPAASGAGLGANLGWNTYEGTLRFDTNNPEIPDRVVPVYEYQNDGAEGRSITGGYVYRGSEIVGLSGTYLWADFFVPTLRGFNDIFGSGPIDFGVAAPGAAVAGFLEDGKGEIYAISLSGTISKIVAVGG